MAYRTWADEGYVPRYRFVRPIGSEGLYNEGIWDVTNTPQEPAWGYTTPSFGTYPGGIPVNQYHPLWNDPTFLYDLMRWQQAATGQPGSGWAQGDNAGDGAGLGSLLSNEFVLAALATGIGGAANAGLFGGAPAASAGTLATEGSLALTPAEMAASGGGTLGTVGGATGGAGAGGAGLMGGSGGASSALGGAAGAGGAGGLGGGTFAGGSTAAGGILGTGITAKQAIAGAQLATGLGGMIAGGGGKDRELTPAQAALEANNIFAGNLALASIPPRLAHLQEGLNATTTLANASPMALTQRLAPQIEEARAALQKMFQQSSQRFGPLGGGQTQREQTSGAQAIGGKLSQVATQIPDQARTALRALIENFQTTPQPATPILQTGTQPFDSASLLAALKQGAELGKVGNRIDQWLSPQTSSSWNTH